MRIEQLMATDVATCGPDDTLNQAARIMWERDCGFVPVVENAQSRRAVGVITDRDVCMAAYTRGKPLPEIRVREVMSTRIRSCKPGDTPAAAEGIMGEAQVHRLPVVDEGGRLFGVISLADLAREAGRERGSKHREVSTAEIGETLASIRRPRAIAASTA
jgi:CBS domain-containing protein